ncbi:hypothetical protein Bpfe_009933 [Biomphalaria pfeifferi]|uniref:Uncharacterized protein n=1 Tax=Biomphalaria pfeifferi TaxID=112525 RepID=A0AAD8BU80_BIOPF|nr:hypothetical protein Bpfe_009933 [Biomphalaria pfeifferi]
MALIQPSLSSSLRQAKTLVHTLFKLLSATSAKAHSWVSDSALRTWLKQRRSS